MQQQKGYILNVYNVIVLYHADTGNGACRGILTLNQVTLVLSLNAYKDKDRLIKLLENVHF